MYVSLWFIFYLNAILIRNAISILVYIYDSFTYKKQRNKNYTIEVKITREMTIISKIIYIVNYITKEICMNVLYICILCIAYI